MSECRGDDQNIADPINGFMDIGSNFLQRVSTLYATVYFNGFCLEHQGKVALEFGHFEHIDFKTP